jgi:hypothetical protein
MAAGGTLKESFDQFIVQRDSLLHDLLQNEHLAASIVGRTKGHTVDRTDSLAKATPRALLDLSRKFIFKIVW